MTRQFFNPSRPVFVKQTKMLSGKVRQVGERFDWQKFNVPELHIQILFDQDILHHNPELEDVEEAKSVVIGDGLDNLTLEELHAIVDTINKKVREKVKTDTEYRNKKCAIYQKDRDKQISRIRQWRRTFGDFEN